MPMQKVDEAEDEEGHQGRPRQSQVSSPGLLSEPGLTYPTLLGS